MRESTLFQRRTGQHDILRVRLVEEKMVETENKVFDFEAESLDGSRGKLADYRGKVLLIVNTASRCGFTPQYAGLEKIYRSYKDRGLVILGFPCNQFGAQEPGSAAEIGTFCEKNYGVSFPMFAKIEVNGENAHPLYRYLKRKGRESSVRLTGVPIKWNFTKFLVDRAGKVVARFAPNTRPESLGTDIEKVLNANEG